MIEKLQLKNTESKSVEGLDKHSSDLAEAGVQPIFVCVGTSEDFEERDENDVITHPEDKNFDLKNVEQVNWRWVEGKTSQEDFLSNGPFSYVMSGINGENKLSQDFYPCTGVVVAGVTASGKKISFLNENRRLYFVRPEITQVKNPSDKDFLPADFPASEVSRYKDRWEHKKAL